MSNPRMFGTTELKQFDILVNDADQVYLVTMEAGRPRVTNRSNHCDLSYYVLNGTLNPQITRVFRSPPNNVALLMRRWWNQDFISTHTPAPSWLTEIQPLKEMTITEIEKKLGHRVKVIGETS